MWQGLLQDELKHRSLDPTRTASDCVGLGWSHSIYISNKFPKVMLMLQIQGPHSGNHWLEAYV